MISLFTLLFGFTLASAEPIRLLVPNTPYAHSSQKVLTDIISDFNKLHPETPVSLIRRGEEYSSLKDLIAFQLAGSLPELAVVESGEISAAAAALNLPNLIHRPFLRTVALLIYDEAAVKNPPKTWKELQGLANNLTTLGKFSYSLAVPLQGARGLWTLEALAGKKLWTRKAGGLKANRELEPEIELLQTLQKDPALLRSDINLDRALQDFIERKTPILVGSLDVLPHLQTSAKFSWRAALLPRLHRGMADLGGGSDLVVTRESPAVKVFLDYFYLPGVSARWTRALGTLPPQPETVKSSDWHQAMGTLPQYEQWVMPFGKPFKTYTSRSTDPDVVRARSAWIQGLRLLFGPMDQRVSTEMVFLQLDRAFNQK